MSGASRHGKRTLKYNANVMSGASRHGKCTLTYNVYVMYGGSRHGKRTCDFSNRFYISKRSKCWTMYNDV